MNARDLNRSQPGDSFGRTCRIERVLEDGALSVVMDGRQWTVEPVDVHPVTGSVPISTILDRIAASNIPLRCRVSGEAGGGRVRAELHYLAWHDKSGEVWLPLVDLHRAQGASGSGASET